MPEIKHSPLRRFFGSRLFLFTALPLSALVVFGYVRSYYQGYKIRQEIRVLQAEVGALERKKIESLDILKYVQSDNFVERQGREELNLKRPGEKLLVVTNRDNAAPDAEDKMNEPRQLVGNAVKWWYYFAHKSSPNPL